MARSYSSSPAKNDLTGVRFGRLIVTGYDRKAGAFHWWKCRCDCGSEGSFSGNRLTLGQTASCGCLQRDSRVAVTTTHGKWGTPEYRAWAKLIARCENPQDNRYARYGGRGIRVCHAWRQSFAVFLKDVGPRPTAQHSIDRIDNDGHYEPGNCRWATRKEQRRNNSQARFITAFGERKTLDEWASDGACSKQTICDRLARGWSPEDAVGKPADVRHGRRGRRIEKAAAAL